MRFIDKKILIISVIVFIGYVGVSLPFTIFAPLFLTSHSHTMVPIEWSLYAKTLILSSVFAIYALGQVFGNPILGYLSDRMGRKKILLFSLYWSMFSYILTGLAIKNNDLTLLMVSRFLAGCSEGNMAIAQSAAADFSLPNEKGKNFSLIHLSASLGFILGPIIGGFFYGVFSWATYPFPFYFASLIIGIAILLVHFTFQETFVYKVNKEKTNIFLQFRNLLAVNNKDLQRYFIIGSLCYFGLSKFLAFSPTLLVSVWDLSINKIAFFNFLMSSCMSATFIFVIPYLTNNRFSSQKLTAFSSVVLGMAILFSLFLSNSSFLFFLMTPIFGIMIAISGTTINMLISDFTDKDNQGISMGIFRSLNSITKVIGCLLGGIVSGVAAKFPITIGAIALLFVGYWLWISEIKAFFKRVIYRNYENKGL